MINNNNDENKIYFIIGQNLKRIRKEKGLTQKKLAEESNYSLSFIGNLESQKVYQTISVGSIYHLSKILNVHITELLKDLP